MTKKCVLCGQHKIIDEFEVQNSRGRSYRRNICKVCRLMQARLYHHQHQAEGNVRSKTYRIKHRVELQTYHRIYRATHRTERQSYNKIYWAKHRAEQSDYQQKRYRTNPQFKISVVLRTRLHQAIRDGEKRGTTIQLLGCSAAKVCAHIENQFQPGMTWINWGTHGWHIDHIRPLASFNLQDPRQLAQACHFTNLRPLWARDNLQRPRKLP